MPDATPTNELRALNRLAFDELGIPRGIGQIHHGIAGRAFWAVGPLGRPVKLAHDAMSRRVFSALGAGSSLFGRAADAALARRGVGDGLGCRPRGPGSAVLAALNGLIGDRLERDGSPLPSRWRCASTASRSCPTAPRWRGVPGRDPAARRLPPRADGDRVLLAPRRPARGASYGTRLARDLGSRRSTSATTAAATSPRTAARWPSCSSALVAAWPVEVERGRARRPLDGRPRRPQRRATRRRGTAMTGRARAPRRLARHAAHGRAAGAGRPLRRARRSHALPETRPFGALPAPAQRRASATCARARWSTRTGATATPTRCARAACQEVPLLEGATHCFVSATVTRSPRHPLGRLLGDTLVLAPSASGRSRTRRIAFDAEYGPHVGATHHLALLNHPAVYEQLRRWLATPPGRQPPRTTTVTTGVTPAS